MKPLQFVYQKTCVPKIKCQIEIFVMKNSGCEGWPVAGGGRVGGCQMAILQLLYCKYEQLHQMFLTV